MDENIITDGSHVGQLNADHVVRQTFRARADGLTSVSLWLATFAQKLTGTVSVTIVDERGKVLRESSRDAATIEDNTWQAFKFEPLSEARNKTFHIELKARASGPLTVWNDSRKKGNAWVSSSPTGTLCFRSYYAGEAVERIESRLLATVAQERPLPKASVGPLLQLIRRTLVMRDWSFLRLAHLLAAVGQLPPLRRVLSVGCGQGYQESYLATRFPDTQVDGRDLYVTAIDLRKPNLSFEALDIVKAVDEDSYDLVYSIEVLEHIEDYRTAFRNMVRKVRSGGHIYVSIPFANAAEQKDERLCAQEMEAYGHYTPGFSHEQLTDWCERERLRPMLISNMFDIRLMGPLNQMIAKIGPDTLEDVLDDIVGLSLCDLRERSDSSRVESVGIKLLAQKI